MTYSLTRTKDGAGDSGNMSSAIFYENGEPERIENSRPFVGAVMIVGTFMAGLFSAQDYWQTTPVIEILEEHVDDEGDQWVKFKTQNSEYIWKEF